MIDFNTQLTHEEFAYIRQQSVGKIITLRGTMFILTSITETVAGYRIYLTNISQENSDCVMFYPNPNTICLVGLNKEDVAAKDMPLESLSKLIGNSTTQLLPYIFSTPDLNRPFIWPFPSLMTVKSHKDEESYSQAVMQVSPLISDFTLLIRDIKDVNGIQPGDIIEF